MKNDWENIAKVLAEHHVEWFLKTLRPLLIDHMTHGFKHGMDYKSRYSVLQPNVQDGSAKLRACIDENCQEERPCYREACLKYKSHPA